MTSMRLYTAEEYAELDDNRRTELVRGVVQVLGPVVPAAGSTAGEIAYAIRNYLETHPIGVAFARTGYVTERDPDTVRGPAVSFMTYERAKEVKGDEFAQVAPDLAIEVLLPSNTEQEIAKKVAEYLAIGARLVWISDPMKRTVTVLAPGALSHVLAGEEFLDGGDVLPGFRVEVKKLFRWPPHE
jgi:Uma2 family endonuclease